MPKDQLPQSQVLSMLSLHCYLVELYFPLPVLTHTTLGVKGLEIRGVIKMSILQVCWLI